MRYFLSTGEASGELAATLLARAIAAIDGDAAFEGIGSNRMREAGVDLWRDNAGWASMGPLAAIPRIPALLATMYRTAAHVRRTQPDAVVLVDFGAFNLRLAKRLRRLGYAKPILDLYPPATWLDDPKRAREVAGVATAITAFAHQRDFYRSLGLPVQYFGHPLAGRYEMRPPRAAPAADGGTVALLPGSRSGELRYHVPVLLEAYARLKARRPALRGVVGAADDRSERSLRASLARFGSADIELVRGAIAALRDADAAWVASGTAVLETALSGVPAAVLYVISSLLAGHARRVYPGTHIALPNLVLGREVVPEFLQERATAENLERVMDGLLRDPFGQYAGLVELRTALGPPDALARCAAFAVALAKSGRA